MNKLYRQVAREGRVDTAGELCARVRTINDRFNALHAVSGTITDKEKKGKKKRKCSDLEASILYCTTWLNKLDVRIKEIENATTEPRMIRLDKIKVRFHHSSTDIHLIHFARFFHSSDAVYRTFTISLNLFAFFVHFCTFLSLLFYSYVMFYECEFIGNKETSCLSFFHNYFDACNSLFVFWYGGGFKIIDFLTLWLIKPIFVWFFRGEKSRGELVRWQAAALRRLYCDGCYICCYILLYFIASGYWR